MYLCKVIKTQNDMKTQKIKIENYSVLSLSNLLTDLFKVNVSNFKIESELKGGKCIRLFFLNNKLIAQLDINNGNGFYFLP